MENIYHSAVLLLSDFYRSAYSDSPKKASAEFEYRTLLANFKRVSYELEHTNKAGNKFLLQGGLNYSSSNSCRKMDWMIFLKKWPHFKTELLVVINIIRELSIS